MGSKELRVVNFVLVLLIIAATYLTFRLSLNHDVVAVVKGAYTSQSNGGTNQTLPAGCTKQTALPLPLGNEPHIKKLDEYQRACASFVTNRLMVFTGFSESIASADTNSALMADKLKAFKAAGISPIVIAEPYSSDSLMSYDDYLKGRYDAAMDRYFKRLKELGVEDAMMGTWVPFPETNTPNWNNKTTEPRDFALAVNKYMTVLKRYFPTAKGSVLLNATTYEPNDLEYANGNYLSLIPYLQEIDESLISSIGIQGFPWVSNATTKRRDIFRASEFLQPDLAIEAAQELRTRDIWFNTGSFAAKYTNDPTKTVKISLNERKAILTGILEEAKKLQTFQQNEYRVSVNLFSEDKSLLAEATDWSYFQNEDSKTILKEFIQKAEELSIPVSLFDRDQ